MEEQLERKDKELDTLNERINTLIAQQIIDEDSVKILSKEHRFAMQQVEIKQATIIELNGRCVKLEEDSVILKSELDHVRKELDDFKTQNDVIRNQNDTLIGLLRSLQQMLDGMKQFLK
jgi:chromosome segregation ATPase